jgi:hypothetical protein
MHETPRGVGGGRLRRRAPAVHLIGAALLAALGAAADISPAIAQPLPQAIPEMQIRIFNNDPKYNVYPVLTTGTSTSNLWLQAWFKVTKAQARDAAAQGKPFYPKTDNFRLYINPTGSGIPPKSSVTLTLPFITQLVPTSQVDPRKDDQFIDWWGGGRVEIFAAPVADGAPPPELTELYTRRSSQTEIRNLPAGAKVPTCQGCQPLKLFKDTGGVFKNNAPSQLTEYTLGVINQDADPPALGTFFGAVDIDVSYVDTAALPAAMAPWNPEGAPLNQVGYVGTLLGVDAFKDAMSRFITPSSPFAGWPRFLSDTTKQPILKLASTLHATAGDPDLAPPPWPPIERLREQWRRCLPATETSPICRSIRTVRQMFVANYDNYKAIFGKSAACDKAKGPVQLTEDLLVAHVYGFSPFVENCSDAGINLIEKTPGYAENNSRKFQEVKATFDELNYWPDGSFNPYLLLIHGRNAAPDRAGTGYVDALNVYAYSVDDAVGNLQADGRGFVIAVGGPAGLPNPNPASPPVHVNFGGPNGFGEWTHYGVCTTDKAKMRAVNPDFRSIAFYVQKENLGNCPISLLARWKPDGKEVVYSFKLKSLDFPYGENSLSPKTHAAIDCSGAGGPIPARLCQDVFAYAEKHQGKGPDTRTVIVPAVYPHQP